VAEFSEGKLEADMTYDITFSATDKNLGIEDVTRILTVKRATVIRLDKRHLDVTISGEDETYAVGDCSDDLEDRSASCQVYRWLRSAQNVYHAEIAIVGKFNGLKLKAGMTYEITFSAVDRKLGIEGVPGTLTVKRAAVPENWINVTFTSPNDVAVDGYGKVYVADANRVVKLTPEGNEVSFLADSVTFTDPRGVAVDGYGNVYVARWDQYTVLKLTHEGVKVDSFFGGVSNFGAPWGVAVDGYGNVYVATRYPGPGTVVKLTPAGRSDGRFVYVKDKFSFLADSVTFSDAYGVAVDGYGNVYVVDGGKVVKLNREGF
jgi:hypothetical protein